MSSADLTDLDNFAHGFPHELFAEHRRVVPVYWHPATEHTPDGEGFWSVATHAETLAVLRDPSTFSSVTGAARPFGGTLLQDLSIAGQVLNTDSERHWLLGAIAPQFGFGSARAPVEWTRSNRHTGIRHLVMELAA